MKAIKLLNGAYMPVVGLGTWRSQPEEIEKAVNAALDAGYSHFDTAFNYNNEVDLGNVFKNWFANNRVKREDLFITTKLPNCANRPKDVERFLKLSLERLKLDYVDLYLIHMPFSFACNETSLSPMVKEDGTFDLDLNNDLVATWKVMEKQVLEGRTKAIGLSNFNSEQVERVYKSATIKPAVLQVELHAYMQQKTLRKLCRSLNIAITAYSPLGSPDAKNHFRDKYNYLVNDYPDILGHPDVAKIAEKHQKSPGQILLRHLVQQDIIVIPKSKNPDRIKSNIDVFNFELDNSDMNILNKLDRGSKGRLFDFRFFKGVEAHPEYPFKLVED